MTREPYVAFESVEARLRNADRKRWFVAKVSELLVALDGLTEDQAKADALALWHHVKRSSSRRKRMAA